MEFNVEEESPVDIQTECKLDLNCISDKLQFQAQGHFSAQGD